MGGVGGAGHFYYFPGKPFFAGGKLGTPGGVGDNS